MWLPSTKHLFPLPYRMILMFSLPWFSLQICGVLFCENLVHTNFSEDQAASIFRVQP